MGLALHEAAYLDDVDRAARSLTGATRRRFVDDTAEILGGRPVAVTRQDLDVALGTPDVFVDQLRRDEGLAAVASPIERWRDLRTAAKFAQLAIVLVLVGGWLAYRSYDAYHEATVEVRTNCAGMTATDQTSTRAAGVTEWVVPYRPQQRIGIFTCLNTQESGVIVERVYLADVPGYRLVMQVGFEVEETSNSGFVGDASAHAPFDPDIGIIESIIWFERAFCRSAGSQRIGSIAVDYTYRGRSKTAILDLRDVYTVDSDEQCTEDVRAAEASAEREWEAVVGSSALDRGRFGDMPLGLWPYAVSHDLCRYLWGVEAPREPDGTTRFGDIEPLQERAVFQVASHDDARLLIDGAVLGICPDFADRRDALHQMLVL